MRIGFDTHVLATNLTGTANYTRNLLRQLKVSDRRNTYVGLTSGFRLPRKSLVTKIGNAFLEILYTQVILLAYAKRERLDLLHCPANVCPIINDIPRIVTIYDLSFFPYPESYDPLSLLYMKSFIRASAIRADQIVTISEASKADIVRYFCIDSAKITVTYLGISEDWGPIPQGVAKCALSPKYGFAANPYILAVGELVPRKNYASLLRGYAKLISGSRQDWPDLVFVGPSVRGYGLVLGGMIDELGIMDRVHFCGYVPQHDLINFMNGAELLAFLSLHEGFGIPLLEAMSCGIPVLASNRSSIPEVVGDAALKVDPTDTDAIEDGLNQLLQDPLLRKELAEHGRQQARMFSWEKAARRTIEVYDRVGTGISRSSR